MCHFETFVKVGSWSSSHGLDMLSLDNSLLLRYFCNWTQLLLLYFVDQGFGYYLNDAPYLLMGIELSVIYCVTVHNVVPSNNGT